MYDFTSGNCDSACPVPFQNRDRCSPDAPIRETATIPRMKHAESHDESRNHANGAAGAHPYLPAVRPAGNELPNHFMVTAACQQLRPQRC